MAKHRFFINRIFVQTILFHATFYNAGRALATHTMPYPFALEMHTRLKITSSLLYEQLGTKCATIVHMVHHFNRVSIFNRWIC